MWGGVDRWLAEFVERVRGVTVVARGHANIVAAHRSTFEITMDSYLTKRGDCIIGTCASMGVRGVGEVLGSLLRRESSLVIIELRCGVFIDRVVCWGSPKLGLRDERRLIVRRSRFVDDATLCIEANKAARDLDRRLVECLQRGGLLIARIMVLDVGSLCPGSWGRLEGATIYT